ncbi:DUF3422 domain-containing protein [Denitratisoma sp. agr-D3]
MLKLADARLKPISIPTPTAMTVRISPQQEHPLRQRLNDEVHARPPTLLTGQEWVSYLAVIHDQASAEDEEAHLRQLCHLLGSTDIPLASGDQWVLEIGGLRLKRERHNEFSSFTFFRQRQTDDGADTTALDGFPQAWVQAIPGKIIVAAHVEFRSAAEQEPDDVLRTMARATDTVVTTIGDGAAWVFSDFRLREGFTHFLVLSASLNSLQAGRTVQRLLEIETYRMMALLAFPVAKEVGRLLGTAEQQLADLMERMGSAETMEDERLMLQQLTRLAADIEHSITRSAYRFGATQAYHRLVEQRIDDLRERRVEGFPTLREYMGRRLAPAVATCSSVARRQDDLSSRIARESALLRTRVDMELERQNQQLLSQMNRRAKLQLRLQETVEGLSVVAITYYASQLVSYLAKGISHYVDIVEPSVVAAASIPVIALLVAFGIRRLRRALTAEEGEH